MEIESTFYCQDSSTSSQYDPRALIGNCIFNSDEQSRVLNYLDHEIHLEESINDTSNQNGFPFENVSIIDDTDYRKIQEKEQAKQYDLPMQLEEENNLQTTAIKQVIGRNRNTGFEEKKKKNQRVGVVDILHKLTVVENIRLSFGIQIQSDGIIRFSHSIGCLSFGFQPMQIQQINYQKNNRIFESSFSQPGNLPIASLQDALVYLYKVPVEKFEKVYEILNQYQKARAYMIKITEQVPLNKLTISEHDESFLTHIEACQKYIQQYTLDNPNKMFTYTVGRINLQSKDVEVARNGISKSFLDLLGIDESNFTQLLLRNQKIDLIQDKQEILDLSLQGLLNRFNYRQETSAYQSTILTFDGFPLKIYYQRQNMLPEFKGKKMLPFKFEFMLLLTEFDVELTDLQNLIQYRERLGDTVTPLSYDDFLRKELSFLLEDVEYSVHSQLFSEKFYPKNINNLKLIQKEQITNQSNSIRQKCGYKHIKHPTNINPIEIIVSQK